MKLRKQNRLSSAIGGNREMTNHIQRPKCQIYQGKQNFLTIVDMFSNIKQKSVKPENKEHIKLHLFYCKISTLF